jgi:uncharacterized protein
MHPSIRLLCAALAAFALAGCVTMAVQEDHFFVPGPAQAAGPPSVAEMEPLEITTTDGVKLAGVYVRQPGAKFDVVYFGGNASRVDDHAAGIAHSIAPLPVNMVFFDYRGYGRSTGTPTIEALKQDALVIVDDATKRAAGRPVIVHGFSLGSFMAAYAAEHRPVAGLVLESTAPDVETWAKNQVPWYAKPFVRLRIAPALLAESNEQRLRAYTGPLLLMTGSADPVTPPKFASALEKVSRSTNKRVAIVRKASHGDAMAYEAAVTAYREFLDSL